MKSLRQYEKLWQCFQRLSPAIQKGSVFGKGLTLSLIRQFCSRRLWTYFVKHRKSPWQQVENIVAKGEIARFVQFLFCHYVFKKPSAAEASESVCMRERVKVLCTFHDNIPSKLTTIIIILWNLMLILLNLYFLCISSYATCKRFFLWNIIHLLQKILTNFMKPFTLYIWPLMPLKKIILYKIYINVEFYFYTTMFSTILVRLTSEGKHFWITLVPSVCQTLTY